MVKSTIRNKYLFSLDDITSTLLFFIKIFIIQNQLNKLLRNILTAKHKIYFETNKTKTNYTGIYKYDNHHYKSL